MKSPTPLIQFIQNSLRLLQRPHRLKVIKSSYISQRAWPGRRHEVRSFATKLQTVITSVSIVRSGPNFTCLMRVTHWTRLFCNIDSRFKAPPTGDRKCHVLYFGKLVLAALSDSPQTWSAGTQGFNDEKSYTVDPIHTKLTEVAPKASPIKSYQKLLHKSKGVARPAPWSSLFRH